MTTPTTGVPKSCLNCPSYVPKNDTIAVFGKATGAPMCQRFGYVLGTPQMMSPELAEVGVKRAENCDKFGWPRATENGNDLVAVILDPDAREQLSDLDPNRQRCRSCAMCERFVPDDKVEEKLGFTTGLCAAKGKLIFPSRRVDEATSCPFRKRGPVRDSADGLQLIPILQITTRAAAQANSDDLRRHPNEIVDPNDYPTDREVTPDEVDMGIRAWRKISDPEGYGEDVFAPIFNPEFFSKEERAKIPKTGDKENPELYLDHNGMVYKAIVLWRELEETPMAWGEPGVGKTEFFRYLAWLMQLPFYRFPISGASELDDLAGKMLFNKEEGTYFHYGRISLAFGRPCVLVVDEPNTGPPEVWEFLRPTFDNSKTLFLDMGEGISIDQHPECHLGLAANPAWSALNVGTNVIGDADASRLMHLEFALPPEHIERAIIKNRVRLDGWEIDEMRLNFLIEVAKNIRELCKSQTISATWALRPQIQVARALPWFGPLDAYRLAAADMMEPQQRDAILDQVRGHLPSPPAKFPPINRIEAD